MLLTFDLHLTNQTHTVWKSPPKHFLVLSWNCSQELKSASDSPVVMHLMLQSFCIPNKVPSVELSRRISLSLIAEMKLHHITPQGEWEWQRQVRECEFVWDGERKMKCKLCENVCFNFSCCSFACNANNYQCLEMCPVKEQKEKAAWLERIWNFLCGLNPQLQVPC